MRKFIIVLSLMCGFVLFVNAQQYKSQLKKSRQDIKEAKGDLAQAKNDSIAEYQQFKTESMNQIQKNNTLIQDFKREKADKIKEANSAYNKKIADLENRNNSLNDRIINYKADGNTNWVVFKRDFKNEMDAWEKSFMDSRDE